MGKLTNKQKEELLKEHKYYIDWLVVDYLLKIPTFFYMKEDWTQELYIHFNNTIDTYDNDRGKLTTYLYTILRNHLGNLYKKECKRGLLETAFKDSQLDREEPSYEMDTFEELIGGLTEKQQRVLRLKYVRGLPNDKIGEVMGVSKQAVQQMHTRAINSLRKTLEV